jgi:L-fuconolactonase
MAQGHLAPVRPEWLLQMAEEAIEPDLAICDTHHHLWDHGPGDRYLVEEMLADIRGGHEVVSSVYIDCFSMYRKDGPAELKPVGETEFVESLVAGRSGTPRIAAGIVGKADLNLGSGVARVLEAHLAASPRFRGVRHWLNYDAAAEQMGLRSDAPPRLAYDPSFREGFAVLGKMGLSFDAWLYFPQMPDLVDLARAFPDTPIVLNHAGGLLGAGPYARREEWFAQWKRDIAGLAKCGNVMVKLGGFGVGRAGFGWHERPKPPSSRELAEALRPYCLWCIEQFGPSRCMFESNFPADKAGCSYNVVWNAFKRIARDFSPAERAAMFHDSGARFYRL